MHLRMAGRKLCNCILRVRLRKCLFMLYNCLDLFYIGEFGFSRLEMKSRKEHLHKSDMGENSFSADLE